MANVRIQDLAAGPAIVGAAIFEVENPVGTSGKQTFTQLVTYLQSAMPPILTVGSTVVNAGSSGNYFYNNAGVLGERTPTQVTAALNLFTSTLQGLAPSSGGGTTNFLRADGSWAAPPGGAMTVGTTTVTGGTSGNFFYNNAGVLGERTPTQVTAALNLFTSTLQGLAPSSGGGTTNFLRADGTWAAPAGGAGSPGGTNGQIQYNNSGVLGGANVWRTGANQLDLSNTANAQQLRVYNTTDNNGGTPTNSEWGTFDWTTTANVLTIGTKQSGTGTQRSMALTSLNFSVNTAGFVSLAQGMTTISDDGQATIGYYAQTVYIDGRSGTAQSIGIPGTTGSIGFTSTNKGTGGGDTFISRSAAGVIAFGTSTTVGDSAACIKAKTKAGAPVAADIPSGTWALIRDTSGSTTKIYYNNAGTLMSVALT